MAKILIVENSPELLEIEEVILKKNNFEVINVSTREKLIRQLVLNKPDIILLDVILNGEDGCKICMELKQNKEFEHIPIILTSPDIQKLTSYSKYLADNCLQKPLDVLSIIDKIKFLPNFKEIMKL